MTEVEAIDLTRKIEKACEDSGVWCDIKYRKKPYLKSIEIEVSIKITK
jgi:hypothetical protein